MAANVVSVKQQNWSQSKNHCERRTVHKGPYIYRIMLKSEDTSILEYMGSILAVMLLR